MKWHWKLLTFTGLDAGHEIQGNAFGSLADVVAQIEQAMIFHGWGKNPSDCTITIKAVEA